MEVENLEAVVIWGLKMAENWFVQLKELFKKYSLMCNNL